MVAVSGASSSHFVTRKSLNEAANLAQPAASQNQTSTNLPQQAVTQSQPAIKFTTRSQLSGASASVLLGAQEAAAPPPSAANQSAPVTATTTTTATAAYKAAAVIKDPAYTASSNDYAVDAAARSGMDFKKSSTYQVSDEQAQSMIKVAMNKSDRYAATGNNQNNIIGDNTGDKQAVSETNYHYATKGDNPSFSVIGEGDFGKYGDMMGAMKAGALQVDVMKWGGQGSIGFNASRKSLNGSNYDYGTFDDGWQSSGNVRESTSKGNQINGTFGGYSGSLGMSFNVKSFDESIKLSAFKAVAY